MCGLENGRRDGVTFAAVTCASRTDWAVVASRRPGADVARFLEDILDDDDVGANTRAIDQRRTLLVTTTDAPRVDMNRHDVNTNAAAVRIPLRDVLDAVRSVVASLAGRDVSADEPLMDAGLDSLTAVDARAEVSKTFNVTLPATALFDYPTAEALATRVWGELAPAAGAGGARASGRPRKRERGRRRRRRRGRRVLVRRRRGSPRRRARSHDTAASVGRRDRARPRRPPRRVRFVSRVARDVRQRRVRAQSDGSVRRRRSTASRARCHLHLRAPPRIGRRRNGWKTCVSWHRHGRVRRRREQRLRRHLEASRRTRSVVALRARRRRELRQRRPRPRVVHVRADRSVDRDRHRVLVVARRGEDRVR